MKRDPRDALFSHLVRCRAEYKCEHCGKQYEQNSQGLHCSHFWGRRRRALRWHPMNAASHCFRCHQHLGENPVLFTKWIRHHLDGQFDRMSELSHVITHWKKHDLEQIRVELRDEWSRMQRERNEGKRGRIEFNVPFLDDL